MTSNQKPAILIVHGAWHRPIHYTNLVTHLQSKEFTVRIPALTTVGWHDDLSQKGIADDVAVLQSTMAEYLDAGRDIVVVCHSFGGFSGTDSVVGQTVQERRARGQAGGVKAVLYIAAFAPPAPGLSLMNLIGVKDESEHPDWWTPKDGQARLEPKASDLLYSGNDSEVAVMNMNATAPQSLRSFLDPAAHATSEVKASKTYFLTEKDLIVPPEGQNAMATAAGAEIIRLPSGHSPFLNEQDRATIVSHVEMAALASAE